jgi:type II secretory pathway pseudopilin PulG
MRRSTGFTMLEIMVVIALVLMIIVVVLPIFQVTTKTIQTVERRLAVYEAARSILDTIENELRLAVINERGEMLQIKSMNYTDTDVSKGTLCDPSKRAAANTNPALFEPMGYRGKRREADALNYVKMQGGGYRWANNLMMTGSQCFPLSYPELFGSSPEAWKCSIQSSLQYRNQITSEPMRPDQLLDIHNIRLQMVCNAYYTEFRFQSGPGIIYIFDPIFNTFSPGFEVKQIGDHWSTYVVNWQRPVNETPNREGGALTSADGYYQCQRALGAIPIMDLDIAYWDDNTRKFRDPPDNSLISFSPIPKAVRVTITVCDKDKRLQITLARVIQLAVGNGLCDATEDVGATGQVTRTALDTTRLDLDMTPYNRSKNLTVLDWKLVNTH